MDKIKLFCFPYAGGSAIVYSKWKSLLPSQVVLQPIELAGRGRRVHEPFYKDIHEAVDDVYQKIKTEIQRGPYVLFGHSMGALIAYELALKLRNTYFPMPSHLVFSGKGAPHLEKEDEKKYHLMDDEQFKSEVIELGGTPPEFFDHPELRALFLPLLKNDFKMAETYVANPAHGPLDQDITVLLGRDDDLTPEQCEGWNLHTKRQCAIHYFEGGHFFLHDRLHEVLTVISDAMGLVVKNGH